MNPNSRNRKGEGFLKHCPAAIGFFDNSCSYVWALEEQSSRVKASARVGKGTALITVCCMHLHFLLYRL